MFNVDRQHTRGQDYIVELTTGVCTAVYNLWAYTVESICTTAVFTQAATTPICLNTWPSSPALEPRCAAADCEKNEVKIALFSRPNVCNKLFGVEGSEYMKTDNFRIIVRD
jgi:hypothetical protein